MYFSIHSIKSNALRQPDSTAKQVNNQHLNKVHGHDVKRDIQGYQP